MSKIHVGAKIRIKASGRTGTVEQIYDLGVWNVNDSDYVVRLDDGGGAVTISGHAIEFAGEDYVYVTPKCECGLKYARSGGKHSQWCPMRGKDD